MTDCTGERREFLGVPLLILRQRQKNMYLTVRPDGTLRVSCPLATGDAEIKRFVASQSRWLQKRRAAVLQTVQAARTKYEDGDTVLLWGRALPLTVAHGRPYGARLNGGLLLNVPPRSTVGERGELICSFLRGQLSAAIPPLLARWQPVLNVQASGWRVREMTTRWGSCNARTGRLCFNFRLVAKDPRCLEYVVVHELSHLLVANHSPAFWNCVARCLPDWRQRRDLTNQAALQPADA